MKIYNGPNKDDSQLVSSLCGSQLPDQVESTGPEVLVQFRSDFSVGFKGFKLQFARTGESCSIRLVFLACQALGKLKLYREGRDRSLPYNFRQKELSVTIWNVYLLLEFWSELTWTDTSSEHYYSAVECHEKDTVGKYYEWSRWEGWFAGQIEDPESKINHLEKWLFSGLAKVAFMMIWIISLCCQPRPMTSVSHQYSALTHQFKKYILQRETY